MFFCSEKLGEQRKHIVHVKFLWSPEFSELVDRRSIHQLAATCKTNKKTTVVFRRPSDGEVSLILKDFENRVAIILI